MACRLVNLHTQPLRIDLRGGAVLVLAPGDRSAALREEWLYDNHHLAEWERAGWVSRVAARLADVPATPTSEVAQGPAPAAAAAATPVAAGKRGGSPSAAARSRIAGSPSSPARKRSGKP